MNNKEQFRSLNLSNAFLFAVAMADPEICRNVLECILGFPIREVNVRTEDSISIHPGFRSVRLDVRASDEHGTCYNLEMQNQNKRNLPKRSRFYQGEMDVFTLLRGRDFNWLPRTFVIFICTFDPFQRGKYRYTYTYRCMEDGAGLRDDTVHIFLNTKGRNAADEPPQLVNFLRFVENTSEAFAQQTGDPFLIKLSGKINEIKKIKSLEVNYMTLGEYLDDMAEEVEERARAEGREKGIQEGRAEGRKEGRAEGRKEGRAEGRAEGRKEGKKEGRNMLLNLVSRMIKDGKTEEILRLSEDEDFLSAMLEAYHL